MKVCKPFQRVIELIAAQHKLDLTKVNACLRLEQEGKNPLVIEVIGEFQVSIAHYFKRNGDPVQDPEVVMFTGYDYWVPVSITQVPLGIYRTVSRLDYRGLEITHFNPQGQEAIVTVCRNWAKDLEVLGWTHPEKVTVARAKAEVA